MALQKTDFIWHNGKLLPWDEAKVHVLTHSLHYGAGVFEGIRCYKTADGPAVFRLKEHIARLYYSAGVVRMKIPYEPAVLEAAVCDVLREGKLAQGYIRPIAYFGYGIMGVNPGDSVVDVSIACWPWGAYLSEDPIDVKISSFMRIHPKSTTCDAKICGHYVNSIFAVQELKGTHYKEALLLDANGNVAEGPGENFFIVEQGRIVTPPLGNILAGITRATVMGLAREEGLTVVEEPISVARALAADEAFFTGTAAEVTLIRSIDDTVLKNSAAHPIGSRIRERYMDVVYGRDAKHAGYLTRV